jgi:hypothetical protein
MTWAYHWHRSHGEPRALGGVVRLEVKRLIGVIPAVLGTGAWPQELAIHGTATVVPYP